MVWIETPTNPLLKVIDIRAIAERAHARGVLVAVDNTFLTPLLPAAARLGRGLGHALDHQVSGATATLVAGHRRERPGAREKLRFLQNAIGAVPGPWIAFSPCVV